MNGDLVPVTLDCPTCGGGGGPAIACSCREQRCGHPLCQGRPDPGLPVELFAPDGARLAAVEDWCAAMRRAGAAGTAVLQVEISPSKDRRKTVGVAVLLCGFPHTTSGPVNVPPGVTAALGERRDLDPPGGVSRDLEPDAEPAPRPGRRRRIRWRGLHPVMNPEDKR